MSITTNPSVPYFDDLNSTDSNGLTPLDKNYLRILFKPGYSVQTRELNQAQSILQAQLDRLGSSLYKANSPIIGGQCEVDNSLRWIDVTLSNSSDIDFFENISDLTISSTSNSTAVITAFENISTSTSTILRLFIKDRSGQTPIKNDSGTLTINNSVGSSISVNADASGNAIGCTLENGIYFVKGCMASAFKQYVAKIVTNDEENSVTQYNGFAVLKVEENYISAEGQSNSDSTLKDNASGYINALAVGADRYQIVLTLDLVETIDINSQDDYIKIAEISNGLVILRENSIDASGSTLEKILAKRTFEESGDYVVSDFDIELQDVLGADYTSRFSNIDDISDENITTENSQNFYACTISPSVAYVKGTRVDLQNPLTIFGKKARETYKDIYNTTVNAFTNANVGNYIVGITAAGSGLPVFDSVSNTYNLLDSTGPTPVIVGTCKISTIEKIEDVDNSVRLRVYLYDINFNSGKSFQDVATIKGAVISGYGQFNMSVETINGLKINDTVSNNSLFTLPYTQLKTIEDLQVSEKILLGPQFSTGTTVSFNLAGKAIDKSPSSIVVAVSGEIITDFTIANTNSNILTLTSDAFETGDLEDPINNEVSVIASATSNISDKLGIKKLTTESVAKTLVSGTTYSLTGVYHAISVNDTVWELIDDGQRPNEYVNAKVKFIGNGTPPSQVNITHWKFINNGTYYTVNSYRNQSDGQVEISEIPSYQNQKLSDVIDTRLLPTSNDRLALDPYSVISAKVDFYLPRKDLLCVYNDKSFNIVYGSPDINAFSPTVPDNAFSLYELSIPAYTYNINDIIAAKINNKRYTMRDIGSLEKRIGNLEYYTTLSLLEKNASDKSVFEDGEERFKNGFVVDGFRNFVTSDISSVNYKASIDKTRGRLYPYHSGYSVPFSITSPDRITVKNGAAYLNYSETSYITQDQASQFISLQPHEVVSSVGSLQLYPEVDTWSDQTTRPPQTINLFPNLDETLRELGNSSGLLGTDWDKTWATTNRIRTKRGRRRFTVTTQVNSGIDTQLVTDDINNSLGEYISDVSIRPYMRSRSVFVRASGLKPNSQFYFYFDNINVTSYVRPYSLPTGVEDFDINSDDGLDESTLLAKYSSGDIISDANGEVTAVFIVPNNDSLKFSSGEKTLRITNSPRNLEEESTSIADAKFISNGLGVTRNETIVSTSVPRIRREQVTRTRQIIRRHDPIAQTFKVDEESGIFVTSVDLSFASKPTESNAVGVQVYIVSTKNGYPTNDILPGSEAFVKYDDIVTGEDITKTTTFTFPQPVYLEGNNEYALVVFSESNEYNIYIAEMGGTSRDLATGALIVNQAALGVFFTSSNKTTWTAYQNRDLKFKLNRAVFATQASVVLNPVIGSYLNSVDISSFVGASSTPNSSWPTSSTIATVSEPDLVTGVQAEVQPIFDPITTAIVDFKIVKAGFGYTNAPTITVQSPATGTPTKSGTFIGKLPIFKVGAFNLNQKEINISGKTSIVNQLKLGSTVYNVEANIPFESVTNTNHTIANANKDQTTLTIGLSSSDDRLSPVIDLNSLTLQTREYLVTNSTNTSSTYLTKQINLNNPSDQLDVWIDINRPTSTSNIKVYANFKDIKNENIGAEWQELDIISNINNAINSNRDIFTEAHFMLNPNEAFSYFTVKIVFIGENTNDITVCKDLRIIATV